KVKTERRRQHFSGEFFRVVARDFLALTEAVMLRQVPVEFPVPRDRHTNGRGNQTVRLAGGRLGHHDERDLTGLEALHPLRTREQAAFGRKDAGYAHEIAGGYAGRAKGELERGQLFAVLSGALREKHLLGYESNHVTLLHRGKVHGKHEVSDCQQHRVTTPSHVTRLTSRCHLNLPRRPVSLTATWRINDDQ